jgi:uncharacterized protein YciI
MQFRTANMRLQSAFSHGYCAAKNARKEVNMKFVVLFGDDPDASADVRRKHMSEHLAFLERNSHQVNAAGPMKTPDGQAAGGIWIVDANDVREVDQLVKEDPFWPTGLRKSVRILAWSQVYADGKRLITV